MEYEFEIEYLDGRTFLRHITGSSLFEAIVLLVCELSHSEHAVNNPKDALDNVSTISIVR